TAAQFEQLAARHLMHNGRYAAGEALLRSGYRHLGLAWHESRPRLIASIAWRALPSSLRSVVLPRRETSLELRRARAELLGNAGAGVENFDPLRAIHNALVCCDEAEGLPDPGWRVRARGARSLLSCHAGLPGMNGLSELRAARDAAEVLGDLRAQRDIEGALA